MPAYLGELSGRNTQEQDPACSSTAGLRNYRCHIFDNHCFPRQEMPMKTENNPLISNSSFSHLSQRYSSSSSAR